MAEVGFITDLEGSLATFERYLAGGGSVLRRGASGRLELANETFGFVFGGDLTDRGPGDLRLMQDFLDLKARHPNRVALLMGNRDLNKMRLTAELDAAFVARGRPEAAFDAWWDPKAPSLAQHLARESLADNQKHRLQWMLRHTLGSGDAFEHRRAELHALRGGAENTGPVSDEEVLRSYLASVEREDGEVASYLANAQIAAIIGDTLFVHGAAEERALGFVPSPLTRFAPHGPEELAVLPGAREGLPLREWVQAINDFAAAGVADWRAAPRWRADGTRGGEALLAYQCRPAIAARTVVVTCYVDGKNMPTRKAIEEDLKEGLPYCSDPMSIEAMRYLLEGGVRRVVVGHKPSGEAPAVLRSGGEDSLGFEVISADTNYATNAAPDFRGGAWCEVRISLASGGSSHARLRGELPNGAGSYDFALPPLGRAAAPKGLDADHGDPFVGRQTVDGWWVRVRLGSPGRGTHYLLSRGEGRNSESCVMPATAVQLAAPRTTAAVAAGAAAQPQGDGEEEA